MKIFKSRESIFFDESIFQITEFSSKLSRNDLVWLISQKKWPMARTVSRRTRNPKEHIYSLFSGSRIETRRIHDILELLKNIHFFFKNNKYIYFRRENDICNYLCLKSWNYGFWCARIANNLLS